MIPADEHVLTVAAGTAKLPPCGEVCHCHFEKSYADFHRHLTKLAWDFAPGPNLHSRLVSLTGTIFSKKMIAVPLLCTAMCTVQNCKKTCA